MLLRYVSTLSPFVRNCGTVGLLSMLASGGARLIPRLVSRGKNDAKRNQQEQFDSKLCNVFWGFSASAGEPLGCFVDHS